MALEDYRELQVLEESSGVAAGGEAISSNFRTLANWRPKCKWDADSTAPSGSTHHPGTGWFAGSLWLQVDGDPAVYTLWICVWADEEVPEALWKSVTLS